VSYHVSYEVIQQANNESPPNLKLGSLKFPNMLNNSLVQLDAQFPTSSLNSPHICLNNSTLKKRVFFSSILSNEGVMPVTKTKIIVVFECVEMLFK
jgi:hypothetical protein